MRKLRLPQSVKDRIAQAQKDRKKAQPNSMVDPADLIKRARASKQHPTSQQAGLNKSQTPDFAYNFDPETDTYTFMTKALPKGRPRLSVNKEMLRMAVLSGDFVKACRAFSIRTPKKTLDYENNLRFAFSQIVRKYDLPMLAGDVAITIDLYHKNLVFGDVDNQAKAILDAMNTILFQDDKSVADLHIRRHRDASDDFFRVQVKDA